MKLERDRSADCLSDLVFDRLLAGEIDDQQRRFVASHLEKCIDCQARYKEIIIGQQSFQNAANGIVLKGNKEKSSRRPLNFYWLAASSAALIILFTGLWIAVFDQRDLGTRTKGDNKIGFFVKHGAKVRQGSPGEVICPGDSLRFVYSSRQPTYLAIVSVDQAQQVSVYYPDGKTAKLIEAGREIALPESVVVDDVLGQETFYGLFCREPVELERIKQIFAGQPNKPPIPDVCTVDSFQIVKEK
jgi:hypothetical protein